jgi:hypothetical protein
MAYSLAKGDLVVMFEDDDLSESTRVEKQVNEFMKDPDLGVSTCSMYIIDANGNMKGTYFEPPRNQYWFRFTELLNNYVAYSTIMVNKTLVGDAFYFEYRPTEDWYLWLKLIFEGEGKGNKVKFGHLFERLVYYRDHPYKANKDFIFPIDYVKNF